MENLRVGRVVKIGNSLGVILPVAVIRAQKFARGDTVVFEVLTDSTVLINKPSDEQLRQLRGSVKIIE